jgi:hypothetical protein
MGPHKSHASELSLWGGCWGVVRSCDGLVLLGTAAGGYWLGAISCKGVPHVAHVYRRTAGLDLA